MIKEYDVYYATGGGPIVQGGSDVWVNHWIDNIAPKLNVKPIFVKGEWMEIDTPQDLDKAREVFCKD